MGQSGVAFQPLRNLTCHLFAEVANTLSCFVMTVVLGVAVAFGVGTDTATLLVAIATLGIAVPAAISAYIAFQQGKRDIRPILIPARPDAVTRRVRFVGGGEQPYAAPIEVAIPEARVYAVTDDDAVRVAVCLQNIGKGIAVVRGVDATIARYVMDDTPKTPPNLTTFVIPKYDVYFAPQDIVYFTISYAQSSPRRGDHLYQSLWNAINANADALLDVFYTDHTSRQVTITRIALVWDAGTTQYFARTLKHWYLRHARIALRDVHKASASSQMPDRTVH